MRLGKISVIDRNYFARQAATLLRLAKSTTDPKVAAALVKMGRRSPKRD
jgi:hypothetical protein